MSEPLVVDSSVAVKWYLPEAGSDRAASLLQSDLHLIAPDLLISEVGNVLWKRRRELPAAEIEAIALAVASACPASLYPSSALLQGALAIALAHDRTVYDSLYLALAMSQSCRLVTADENFANALRHTQLSHHIQIL